MDKRNSNIAIKKSSVHFNIFDILIILAVVACIAALGIRYYYTQNAFSDFVEVKVDFIVPGVMESTANSMKLKTVYLSSNDKEVGYIESMSVIPSSVYVTDDNGGLVKAQHPDSFDITGTIVFRGIWSDDAFMINGTIPANVANTILLYSSDIEFVITIEDIVE